MSQLQEFTGTKWWANQGLQQSTRLHLQHWIWQHQIGYTLHPKIESAAEPLKIADVACGNGAWLLDTAQQFPNNECVGLDVTSAHFPNAAWLPANIRLETWDALSDVGKYAGQFDVVHIRAFYSLVVGNDISKILGNLLAILKPGGYLQWEETDGGDLKLQAPDGISHTSLQTIKSVMDAFSKYQSRLQNDWLANLASTLKDNNCTVLADETSQPKPELSRAWSDNMLSVWYGVVNMLPKEKTTLPFPGANLEISQSIFEEWLEGAGKEAAAGVWPSMEHRIVVAKKNKDEEYGEELEVPKSLLEQGHA